MLYYCISNLSKNTKIISKNIHALYFCCNVFATLKLSINVVGRQVIRIPSSFPQKPSLGLVMSTIRHKWIILVVL